MRLRLRNLSYFGGYSGQVWGGDGTLCSWGMPEFGTVSLHFYFILHIYPEVLDNFFFLLFDFLSLFSMASDIKTLSFILVFFFFFGWGVWGGASLFIFFGPYELTIWFVASLCVINKEEHNFYLWVLPLWQLQYLILM